MDRREFLKRCLTLGAFGAAARLCPAFAGLEPTGAVKMSKTAKTVIELWIWGGPCHLESFDPKPNAGRDYNGDHGAIPTNVDGIYVSEYLPELAKIADKYSIIRSMTHPFAGHETATYLMQTGRKPGGGITYPAIGALLAMMNGGNVQHHLPPYVALSTNKGRFAECGFLGDHYAPFATGGNPAAPKFVVDGYTPAGGVSRQDLEKRFALLNDLDSFGFEMRGHPELEAFEKTGEEAKTVLFGKASD